MAHFAQLDDSGVVTQVIVVNNAVINDAPFPDSEPSGIEFCKSLFGGDTIWRQTSYNSSFRKNYAGMGYSYDANLDAFVPPQPFPSWVLDTYTCKWAAPIPYPSDGKTYYWVEDTLSWVLFTD